MRSLCPWLFVGDIFKDAVSKVSIRQQELTKISKVQKCQFETQSKNVSELDIMLSQLTYAKLLEYKFN